VTPRKERFGWQLVAIVAAGLALRVVYVLVSQRDHIPLAGDSYIYSAGADLIALGRGWIEPLSVFEVKQSASHPPLYMLWLVLAAWVDPGELTSQLTFLLWSCVLGTATVLVCGLAGREILGARCGLVAAAVAAVYPGLWMWDGSLLSETMAQFTAAGVVLFAYRFRNRPGLWPALWLAAWCGLAALSRSELLLTVVFVLIPLVLLCRDRSWTQRIQWLVAAGVVVVVVLAPWVGFNASRFEDRVTLSTSLGRTMAAANCDASYYGRGIGFKSYDCIRVAADRATTPDMDESQSDPAMRREALDYIGDHLTRVPLVVAARWGRILQIYDPRQEFELNGAAGVHGRWVAEAFFVGFYVAFALAVVGVVVLRRRRIAVFPLLAIPGIVLISVAMTFGQARYRAPAEVALVLLAAVAIDAAIERRERIRSSPGRPRPAVSRVGRTDQPAVR
jgi:4-amino-4-deoxy-L-arabinose transferase-like glycosyltransferase